MAKKRKKTKQQKPTLAPIAGKPPLPRPEILAAIPIALLFLAPLIHMLLNTMKEPAVRTVAGEQVLVAYDYLIWMYPVAAVLAAAAAALSLRERHTKLCARSILTEPVLWFALFAALMILSTCADGWTHAALHGVGNRRESLFSYLVYVLVYFWCGSRICDSRLKRWLTYGFLGTALLVAIFTLGRDLMGGFPGLAYFEVYAGAFYNRNHYAYYLTIVLLVSAVLIVLERDSLGRTLAAVSFFVNLLVLLRNGTLGGLFATVAGLVLFGILLAWQRKIGRRTITMATAACVVALAAVVAAMPFVRSNILVMLSDLQTILSGTGGEALGHTGHNRMGQWLYALELIRQKPLLGWGVEGAAALMGEHSSASRVHSEYLYYAQSFGLPALLCYLAGVVAALVGGFRRKLTEDPYASAAVIGAFGYAMSACFGISVFYTAPFFFVFLGLGYGGRDATVESV